MLHQIWNCRTYVANINFFIVVCIACDWNTKTIPVHFESVQIDFSSFEYGKNSTDVMLLLLQKEIWNSNLFQCHFSSEFPWSHWQWNCSQHPLWSHAMTNIPGEFQSILFESFSLSYFVRSHLKKKLNQIKAGKCLSYSHCEFHNKCIPQNVIFTSIIIKIEYSTKHSDDNLCNIMEKKLLDEKKTVA